MGGEHVASDSSADEGSVRGRVRLPWRSGTIGVVTLAAAVHLIAQVGQEPSRAGRDFDIFLQVFVGGVILLAVVMIVASWIVWSACRKVRRLRPYEVVFAAMVGMPFIESVSQLAASAGRAAMPKYLWRPIVSVGDAGVTVWYGWLRPRPGLLLPVNELTSVSEVTMMSPGRGRARVRGIRLSVADPNGQTLDLAVSRSTPMAPVAESDSKVHDLFVRIATSLSLTAD